MAKWSTQAAMRECQLAANGELTVVERLAKLLETGQFADVSITVGEGKEAVTFKAHKLLLATASQPLQKLINSSTEEDGEGVTGVIRVTDVDPDAFQHILKYIYTDDLEVSNTTESLTLLKVSKKWGLKSLLSRTTKFLDDFLNEYEPISEELKNDLCELLVLVDEYAPTLKEKCWWVLLKNVNEVIPCQGFLNMSRETVRSILYHEDFVFKNQYVLFEAIRDWGMNQVLEKGLSVKCLQELIGEFLQRVDFNAIRDLDFMDKVIPSGCLSRADMIAFFMSRGLEIPRDLEFNNNNKTNTNFPYEKTSRYKRGFKLSNQEIYKEHEVRFRVDQKVRLLGVGFGFLFSNTDMGITVHCQGPWETRQWRDLIQTYCRVTWEKMKTADVRLMFSEPVIIEANQCYKIVVRISRMSSGTSDVELWGGTEGQSKVSTKEAEFCFLKSAVDSTKEVEDSETENKPGMITDFFYEICDAPASREKRVSNDEESKYSTNQRMHNETPIPGVTERKNLSNIYDTNPSNTFELKRKTRNDQSTNKGGLTSPVEAVPMSGQRKDSFDTKKTIKKNFDLPSRIRSSHERELYIPLTSNSRKTGSSNSDKESENRSLRSALDSSSPPSSTPSSASTLKSFVDRDTNETRTAFPWRRKSQVDEASSYYLAQRPSDIKGSSTVPSFLRSKQEYTKPSWAIPFRPKKQTNSLYSIKDEQTDNTSSQTANSTRKSSDDVFANTTLSKYSNGLSHIKSRYETDPKTYSSNLTSPKYGFDKNAETFNTDSYRSKYRNKISLDSHRRTRESPINEKSATNYSTRLGDQSESGRKSAVRPSETEIRSSEPKRDTTYYKSSLLSKDTPSNRFTTTNRETSVTDRRSKSRHDNLDESRPSSRTSYLSRADLYSSNYPNSQQSTKTDYNPIRNRSSYSREIGTDNESSHSQFKGSGVGYNRETNPYRTRLTTPTDISTKLPSSRMTSDTRIKPRDNDSLSSSSLMQNRFSRSSVTRDKDATSEPGIKNTNTKFALPPSPSSRRKQIGEKPIDNNYCSLTTDRKWSNYPNTSYNTYGKEKNASNNSFSSTPHIGDSSLTSHKHKPGVGEHLNSNLRSSLTRATPPRTSSYDYITRDRTRDIKFNTEPNATTFQSPDYQRSELYKMRDTNKYNNKLGIDDSYARKSSRFDSSLYKR